MCDTVAISGTAACVGRALADNLGAAAGTYIETGISQLLYVTRRWKNTISCFAVNIAIIFALWLQYELTSVEQTNN
jgi:hypothetical protein